MPGGTRQPGTTLGHPISGAVKSGAAPAGDGLCSGLDPLDVGGDGGHESLAATRGRDEGTLADLVGDRPVARVPDPRPDRVTRRSDRPRHDLVIEGGQVAFPPAAAHEDDDVGPELLESPDGRGELARRLGALHRTGFQPHVEAVTRSLELPDEVPVGLRACARDDADPNRHDRDR